MKTLCQLKSFDVTISYITEVNIYQIEHIMIDYNTLPLFDQIDCNIDFIRINIHKLVALFVHVIEE